MFYKMGERTTINTYSTSKRVYRKPRKGFEKVVPLTSTLSGQPPSTAVQAQAKKRTIQLKFDAPLLVTAIVLVTFGLVMLYSASYDYSLSYYGNAGTIFVRQLMWLGLGLVGAVVIFFWNYHIFNRFSVPLMGITILMLVGVLFVNEVRNGAARTLYGGSVQPSELAKLVLIIYLAIWLSSKKNELKDINLGLVPFVVIIAILGALIALQPDLSALVTIVFLGGVMFFLAGGDLRHIGVLLIIALLLGYGIVQLSATGSNRLQEYLSGLQDPIQASYHVQRAFEAFIRGGWFGVGIGNAETKLTGLPVPPTDSIFAVVGEETGVIGVLGLSVLYLMLLWRGLSIARRAPDLVGSLMAAGLSLWISAEAFINMSVIVNLLPFAGNALPFISAGGSNLVVSLAAIGILLNISRLSVQKEEEKGRLFHAFNNLRGRDRRRRVSSSRRRANLPRQP